MATTYDIPAKRAGFAESLVKGLFPNLKSSNSHAFASDVQFVYDWESSAPRYSVNDPLGLKSSGDYGSPHGALLASEHYLKSAQESAILNALRTGDVSAAKKAEQKIGTAPTVKHAKEPGGHISSSTGDWTSSGGPGLLSQISGTITGLPGATANDIGGAAGGIGSLLGKNLVLVVLVVALILVMKK